MSSHDPHTQSASPAPASEPSLEAARAKEWSEKFEGIDVFVAHAKRSAQIEPVVYALNKDR